MSITLISLLSFTIYYFLTQELLKTEIDQKPRVIMILVLLGMLSTVALLVILVQRAFFG